MHTKFSISVNEMKSKIVSLIDTGKHMFFNVPPKFKHEFKDTRVLT